MKKILSLIVIALLWFSMCSMFTPQVNAALDEILVVYIGAHPDDIDIGMSGSLYKHDVNNHPILWVVVTDGGADDSEYYYESDPERGWIIQDAVDNAEWTAPDGEEFNRGFYSEDLSKKRCGIDGSYQHGYDLLQEYDWRTRVDEKVGASVVEKKQMSYPDPFNPSQRILYPDSGLAIVESVYTHQLATDLAYEIHETVESKGYRTDLLYINSHAPEEIAKNADEHGPGDHRITGNAVRKAIDYLHTVYGFGLIDATWYTIYSPIEPKEGHTRYQEDISQYKSQKSDLCKAVWETAYINETSDFLDRATQVPDTEGYWNYYPDDPGNYEYVVGVEYHNPIEAGLDWLRNRQNFDGSWTYSGRIIEENVGLTSMATACFLNYGIDESDSTVEKAVEWILDQQNPDGSITTGSYYAYDTSLAILALIATNNPDYYDEIQDAVDYLIDFQNDEDTGYPESDRYYGGWSYFPGYHWADLSNTQFVMLALYSAEHVKLDDTLVPTSVWSKAEIFLQRCQNRQISNPDYSFYDDGGFIYLPGSTIWAGGQSYGSMTAAGVWGFVTSGVSNDDSRMQDALEWLANNYHIDQNYPIGNQFLYYYLYCLAKAYVLTGTSTVNGHNWYEEMSEFLINQQQTDGHWIGTDSREEPDNVATCWAILALETKAEPIVERSLNFIVESPVDLHLYDPLGRHVGIDYTTGIVELEIPGASYSGPGTEPQMISMLDPMAGTYRVELVGRETGSYTLTIEGVVDTTTVYSESYFGTINPGELYASEATVSGIAGPLTIWTTPPEFEGIIDNTPPSINVETPLEGQALQDGVTLTATVSDPSGVEWVKFSIREPNGELGTPIDPMFESMSANDVGDHTWELLFDTTQLPDGYYLLLANASDTLGNEGNVTVEFSVRNWACLELLPASQTNKAGRTMPVKFSLRVVATVDPSQPFVRNEELAIMIFEKGHSGNILQTSTYGDTARDYRIDSEGELYIINFRTVRKKPTTYVVEIYRKDLLIDSFEFSTVK